MRVVILHSEVLPGAPRDEQDVLVQGEAISRALAELGYEPVVVHFSLDFKSVGAALLGLQPAVVFNLVESVGEQGRLIYLAPALLEFLGVPFTGAGSEAMFVTSNKLIAKKMLHARGIPTPLWVCPEDLRDDVVLCGSRWIIKSVWEHASIGLSEDAVIYAADVHDLRQQMQPRLSIYGGDCYAETYIEGREFNLSLLASHNGPAVLPPAEIRFVDYPEGKMKIVDYRAKWDEGSFEYLHTIRSFDFSDDDAPLLRQMAQMARECWKIFTLSGYARVDFRVDCEGKPWVLEVNANPCLSPDSGFVAAAERAGISFTSVVEQIIHHAGVQKGVSFKSNERKPGIHCDSIVS